MEKDEEEEDGSEEDGDVVDLDNNNYLGQKGGRSAFKRGKTGGEEDGKLLTSRGNPRDS